MEEKKEDIKKFSCAPKLTISLSWIIILMILCAGDPDLIDALVKLIINFAENK